MYIDGFTILAIGVGFAFPKFGMLVGILLLGYGVYAYIID